MYKLRDVVCLLTVPFICCVDCSHLVVRCEKLMDMLKGRKFAFEREVKSIASLSYLIQFYGTIDRHGFGVVVTRYVGQRALVV